MKALHERVRVYRQKENDDLPAAVAADTTTAEAAGGRSHPRVATVKRGLVFSPLERETAIMPAAACPPPNLRSSALVMDDLAGEEEPVPDRGPPPPASPARLPVNAVRGDGRTRARLGHSGGEGLPMDQASHGAHPPTVVAAPTSLHAEKVLVREVREVVERPCAACVSHASRLDQLTGDVAALRQAVVDREGLVGKADQSGQPAGGETISSVVVRVDALEHAVRDVRRYYRAVVKLDVEAKARAALRIQVCVCVSVSVCVCVCVCE